MTTETLYRFRCDAPHCTESAIGEKIGDKPPGWRVLRSTEHIEYVATSPYPARRRGVLSHGERCIGEWARFVARLPPLNCHHGPLRKETLWVKFGAVVAVADLVDVCGEAFADPAPITCGCGPWAARGQYHWRLANVRPLAEPVPCKGALGLWTLPADVEAAVVAQLGEVRHG